MPLYPSHLAISFFFKYKKSCFSRYAEKVLLFRLLFRCQVLKAALTFLPNPSPLPPAPPPPPPPLRRGVPPSKTTPSPQKAGASYCESSRRRWNAGDRDLGTWREVCSALGVRESSSFEFVLNLLRLQTHSPTQKRQQQRCKSLEGFIASLSRQLLTLANMSELKQAFCQEVLFCRCALLTHGFGCIEFWWTQRHKSKTFAIYHSKAPTTWSTPRRGWDAKGISRCQKKWRR